MAEYISLSPKRLHGRNDVRYKGEYQTKTFLKKSGH